MSRSTLKTVENPAAIFAEWSSTDKCLKYYDRKEEINKLIQIPFKFIVLDTLATIKGFSDDDKSGFWSNEVRNINDDKLIVRTKKGKAAEGLYKDIINSRDLTGAKFCQSVYAMANNKIINLQFFGASLGQWIDFRKKEKSKIFTMAVQITGCLEDKKGKTVFFKPVFELIACTPEENARAMELDKELQEYLTDYLKLSVKQEFPDRIEEEHEDTPAPTVNDVPAEQENNFPFPEDLDDSPF